MKKEKEKVCNKDCFHCVHEDCICDEMDAQDYRDARAIEEILNPKTLQQRRIAAKQREYYEQNRESIAAYHREYRKKNRESIAAYHREYRKKNRESIAAYNREYRKKNRESVAAKKREYRKKNRESIAAYNREYRKKNRESVAAKQRGDAIRRCRKDHGYTQREFAMLIGVSQSTVALYETGSARYDPETILRRFPEFRAYMESAACGEEAPQTACEKDTSA